MSYFWVFIGGGLGSICRFGIAQLIKPWALIFPWATLVANLLSCLVLGFFMGIHLRDGVSDWTKWAIMTGFCGGFSTFSTFTNETLQLMQNGNLSYALINIGVSLLICLIGIYIGMKLGGLVD